MKARWRFGLLLLATLLSVGLTLSLARWQLSRAEQKEALGAATLAQGARTPMDAVELAGTLDANALLYRSVRLRGRWLAQHTLFLDNRQMNARPGFFVLTPFALEGTTRVVLVQRGWVSRNFDSRTALPPVETPGGLSEISGRVVPWPAKLFDLGEAQHGVIRQNLDFNEFRASSGLPLLAVSVQQLGSASEGLLRQWYQPDTGAAKHHGYALQWLALAILITLLFVWFQIVKPLRSRPHV